MSNEKVPFDKSVTSKDVAKLAGVSQPTVSRVFSNPDGKGVKPQVRERVIEAAKQIGYRPNLVARGMISGKTNVVGLVVGDSLGPFYNRIINQFVSSIQTLGKQCLVFKVPRQEQIDSIIERVVQFQVEAVVITASAMTKVMAEAMIRNEIPVILFNRFIPGVDISTVYVDAVEGAAMAAEHLYTKGHKNIGYIQFKKETSEETEKKVGFYSKFRQYGIYQMQEEYSGYDYEEGYQAGVRMLSLSSRPSAIFCTSDLIAMGVMDAARKEFNLCVPQELAVVGYDDIEMAAWRAYELTTIHQPIETMIEKTIQILSGMLKGKQTDTKIEMVKPQLVVRRSV